MVGKFWLQSLVCSAGWTWRAKAMLTEINAWDKKWS